MLVPFVSAESSPLVAADASERRRAPCAPCARLVPQMCAQGRGVSAGVDLVAGEVAAGEENADQWHQRSGQRGHIVR